MAEFKIPTLTPSAGSDRLRQKHSNFTIAGAIGAAGLRDGVNRPWIGEVTASSTSQVDVVGGTAWISSNGGLRVQTNISSGSVPIPATGANQRIDRIIAKLTTAGDREHGAAVAVQRVAGSESASPVPASMPLEAIELARVRVGTSGILEVLDYRPIAPYGMVRATSGKPVADGENGDQAYDISTGDWWCYWEGTDWAFDRAGARSAAASTSYSSSGGLARAVFGALTTFGPVAFTRADSNTRIVVPAPGRYLVTAKATVTQDGTGARLCIVDGANSVLLSAAVHGDAPSVSGIVTIGATTDTSKIAVEAQGTSSLSAYATTIDIERVSP